MNERFVTGVNYWPRRKAMRMWSDFDGPEIRDGFALIRAYGMNLVRIFLLWDDFQPEPDRVSTTAMNHFAEVCDIAADNDLSLDVTFFTGHMSGPNWAPRWLLSGKPIPDARQCVSGHAVVDNGYRNPFTDAQAITAEKILLKEIIGEFRTHRAIGIWNLGNEPDLFALPPHAESGRAWVREMTVCIRSIDPAHPVTCGLHAASLTQNNGFRVDQVFAETDIAVMHSYPMYSDLAKGPLDPDYVPFTCALVSALCGKPALMEEFGGCTVPGLSESWLWQSYGQDRTQFMAGEDEFAEYISKVLPKLVDVGATGALLWCYADYDRSIWDRPPCDESRHERHFGLVRPDGSIKPHAEVMRKFAAGNPFVKKATRTVDIPVSSDEFYRDPARYSAELYREYLECGR
jgi:endo-1,4-beta-mannosidase